MYTIRKTKSSNRKKYYSYRRSSPEAAAELGVYSAGNAFACGRLQHVLAGRTGPLRAAGIHLPGGLSKLPSAAHPQPREELPARHQTRQQVPVRSHGELDYFVNHDYVEFVCLRHLRKPLHSQDITYAGHYKNVYLVQA